MTDRTVRVVDRTAKVVDSPVKSVDSPDRSTDRTDEATDRMSLHFEIMFYVTDLVFPPYFHAILVILRWAVMVE